MNEEQLTKLRERINKQFFCGLSIGELGSNQVDEEQLQSFIEDAVTAAYLLGRSEVREGALALAREKPEEDCMEALSAEVHKVYCEQYEKDNGKPYWTNGEYSKLDERTKEYDRNIVRWHLALLKKAKAGWKKELVERARRLKRADWYKAGNRNNAIDDIIRIVEEM